MFIPSAQSPSIDQLVQNNSLRKLKAVYIGTFHYDRTCSTIHRTLVAPNVCYSRTVC